MRPVLLVGFAVIFGLWLVSAYELVQRVAEAERRATTIAERFTKGEELLFTVRAQVFLSSIYTRDAAFDTRPDAASFYRDQLEASRAEVDRALERYLPDVDSGTEREHWTRLSSYCTRSPVPKSPRTPNLTEPMSFGSRSAGSAGDAVASAAIAPVVTSVSRQLIAHKIKRRNRSATDDR
jgi:hypothetical protein